MPIELDLQLCKKRAELVHKASFVAAAAEGQHHFAGPVIVTVAAKHL
jgi:hypothetical protein